MRGSIRLFNIFGISINIHVTFFLLLLLFLASGVRSLVLVIGVFFIVTLHELCHSLVARRFGIEVREITLLPIGGLASMTRMPEKPSHEFFISLAGPLSNIALLGIFFFPMRLILGDYVLFHPLSVATWPLTFAHIYWINLALAIFNLIPAFPMDGGRILRAVLSQRIGYQKATKIAVNFGHIFALIFGYLGITRMHLMLIAIAIFIYMAASGEELQVDIKETLKKFRIRDILRREFLTVAHDATIAHLLELIFRSHQEDFPVMAFDRAVGFITRQDVIMNMRDAGRDSVLVRDVMRKDFPRAGEDDTLMKAKALMEEKDIRALPVFRGDVVTGVITLEDISRVYALIGAGGAADDGKKNTYSSEYTVGGLF